MTAIAVTGAVCGGLLGVAALSFKALDGTYLLTNIVLDGASGFLWLAAGTVAHIRRPANRVGLLMVAVGIGWFVENLQLSRMPVVFSVGLLLTAASSGFLVHLVLAFPAGRLASRPQRLLAAAAYLTALAGVPFAALFSDRRPLGLGHPPNLLLVRYDPQLVDTLWRTIQVVGVVVAAGVVAVLVRRWAGAQPPMRWVLAPVFVTGLVGGIASLVGSSLGPGHPLTGAA
ncbi:MAG: sensor histidine kinase, partial [Pseudonocardiaceae bacterium]